MRASRDRPKLLLVSSVGGHLAELLDLEPAYAGFDRVWVLQDPSPVLPPGERVYVVAHAERDWRVLLNFAELAAIIARERPDAILSIEAGVAVPAAVFAKLARIPFVFVEPSAAVSRLTLTGRLVRRLAYAFFVQWAGLASTAGVRYEGGLL